MATIKFLQYSKIKGKLAPLYLRLSAGRGADIIVKTGETIYPELWNYKKLGKSYEKTCKKWEKISCHTGRRTFCTNAFLAGIPTVSIMQISGHSTETNFLKYIKISKEENARKLAEHKFFNNLKVV